MTIGQLIRELEHIAQQSPAGRNTPVLAAADEEQNRLGDIISLQIGELSDYDDYRGVELGLTKKEQRKTTFIVIVPGI